MTNTVSFVIDGGWLRKGFLWWKNWVPLSVLPGEKGKVIIPENYQVVGVSLIQDNLEGKIKVHVFGEYPQGCERTLFKLESNQKTKVLQDKLIKNMVLSYVVLECSEDVHFCVVSIDCVRERGRK